MTRSLSLRSLLAVALASSSSFTLATPHDAHRHQNHALETRSSPGTKHTIIQMFQWNWDSVAQECAWIGPAGYGFVQVSTPNEHVQGSEWWTDYQVVSYKLVSKRGNADQFRNMVNKCKAAGVGVIVDIVWNHMAGRDGPETGVAGSSWTHYNYPNIYGSGDFHYCGSNSGNDIAKWDDAYQVQNCELANLADLKTESAKVQNILVAFTNSIIDLGVAGFRIDASKHIQVDHQQAIMSKLKTQGLYYTHEVVYEGGGGVTSSQYTGIGDVQEFRYTTLMRDAFNGNNIAQLKGITSKGWLPSNKANVFVVNHDRERGGYLSYKSPNNMFLLANIFSLAYNYGTPTVFSGYSFDDGNAGAPNGGYGSCNGNGPTGPWQCQHRWTGIAGMVKFANQVGTAGLTKWVQGNNNQIAFGRGSAGFVMINNDGGSWKSTFTTGSMPDGKYCDVISGVKNGSTCSGRTITVAGGKISNLSLTGHSAVAIHTGAKV